MKQYYGFVQDFEQNSFGVEEAFSQLRKTARTRKFWTNGRYFRANMLGFRTARGVDVKELERSFRKKSWKVTGVGYRRFQLRRRAENTKKRGEAKKLYEIIPDADDKDKGKIEAVRLTDPDGFCLDRDHPSVSSPWLKNIVIRSAVCVVPKETLILSSSKIKLSNDFYTIQKRWTFCFSKTLPPASSVSHFFHLVKRFVLLSAASPLFFVLFPPSLPFHRVRGARSRSLLAWRRRCPIDL